jgi:NTP pyrophosphatase (non-canonical NTP hydrolase)
MTPEQFTKDALRTESTRIPILSLTDHRIIHAALGLVTESAEIADTIKKFEFYGRPLDTLNLKEEVGDILWYLALMCDALGTTLTAEMERVILKLKTRYPDKFTEQHATVRNLDAERATLEGFDK